ncbi:MAG: SpoIIE family protein phosphatase [Gemmatimonadetes bacterium]|nr:SpoIIE family protein phosphatase [Gemmatimonadota bacterium]
MTASLLAELAPLPPGVASLLDSFSHGHPGVTLRLWAAGDGERLRLYPAEEAAGAAALTAAPRARALRLPDSPGLELEVAGGDVAEPEIAFLAHAVGLALGHEREARSAARELAERYEEINLLYSISEILGSVLSLEDAASRILHEVADVMGARRASLWVYTPASNQLYLAACVGAEGLGGPIPVDHPTSVTARVFRERQPLNLERGSPWPRGTRLEPQPHGQEAFLSVPINYTPPEGGTRTVGVITLVGGTSHERFHASDLKLLTAVASQVGAALETQRLVQESLRQERLLQEMELAHDLQLKLLPATAVFPGPAQVAAHCAPADSVGGDFYQLFRLSGERLGAVIGDVSGHGFSAALMMAMTLSAVAIYAQEGGPPAEVLRRVHAALADELQTTETYLTLFYGVIDPAAGRIVYANAGHPHAFIVRRGGEVVRLAATNPPLGTLPRAQYTEGDARWERGDDLLCLFTDGLAEAFAGAGGIGDEASLLAEVLALRERPPAEIVARLFALAENAPWAGPPDDRSALLVRA